MWTGAIIIPSIIARVLRKKIWLTITGSAFKSSQKMYSGILIFIPLLIGFIEETNYFLADKIILSGSDHMIQDLNLMKYQDKLFPNYYNFYIDTSKFSINTKIFERENIVGYVGRLSPEKGVREFIQAIVLLNSYRKDIKFLIVGDGPLMDECKFIIERSGCKDRVSFLGWVQHNEIKTYFNSMKINVLPSSTEALGGTSLEAMACGAISIVNSVGGLEDTVEDGQTGFVLMNNSPETIAKKIIEVLDNKKLDLIQINARKYIVDNFSYDNVIHNWERLSEGERS
jgi:glycosyltransferase involved in cell wall biosynthesis